MSACPQCGTAARPTDRFCNACGTPIAQAAPPAGAPPFVPPPPLVVPAPLPPLAPPGAPVPYAAPAGRSARCQLGHEIALGASYCAQGHPIALDQMQFASDAYAATGFGGPTVGPYGSPAPPFPAPGAPGPLNAPAAPPPPYVAPGPATYAVNEAARDVAVPPRILRGFLVAYGTNPSGDFWPLTGGRLLVGRFGSAERTDIALQDPTISSRHAAMVIDAASGSITVEDTASTNGTFVNDEHIGFNGRRELRDGDRVRFGAFTAIVKIIGRV